MTTHLEYSSSKLRAAQVEGIREAHRMALARHAKRHYDLDFDWQSEIVVTSGATEALTDCLLGLLMPGDEAILIDPAYDSYRPIIDAIGARAVGVKLDEDGWRLPLAAIDAAVTAKTKLILINSPHNPSGRVFSRAELEGLADIVRRRNPSTNPCHRQLTWLIVPCAI